MKRTVSLVLAAALVLGSIPAGFAATAGETLKGYGVVAGDTNGNLNEDKTITRAEMMTVLARLLGKFEEASKYSIPSTSKDVAGHWNANVIAFAEKEGWTAGKGNGMFDPQGVVTLQETAAFMLKALGYTITDYAKVVEEATAKGLLKDVVAKELTAPVKRSDVFASALNTLNTPAKDATVKLGEKLGYFKSEALTVGEIKANSAKSFEVKFNKAVDPTKVAFSVKRDATQATVTTTWNEAKTVATLTAASKFAEGKYTVVVNDTTDAAKPVEMKKQELTIEKEKITKVALDSETIFRSNDTDGTIGFAVYNQYDEKITDSALSRGLQVRTSTNQSQPVTPDYKTGLLTIVQNAGTLNNLRDMKTVVITFSEPTTGFVFTKTVSVSDSVNAINEVKINGIVNEKGEKVDFVWGATKAYYLDLSVLDGKGAEVTSKSILGSNFAVGQPILRVDASNGITVSLVDHPTKSGQGAFRISLGTAPTFDTPVTFTAVAPYATSGKNNSTLTVTMKRTAKVETFKMFAPATTVSKGRTVEIPFEAYDQSGNLVKDYTELAAGAAGAVTINGGAAGDTIQFVRQSDGTAKLYATLNTKQLYYLTATVANSLTGSYSQISIDVKDISASTRIEALRHAKLYTNGAAWGTLRLTDLTIRDQYDNKIDMRTDNQALAYYVKVTSSDSAVVSVNNGSSAVMMGDQGVTFRGGATTGVATITYELYKTGTATALDSASALAYNIPKKDVVKIELKPEDKKVLMLQADGVIGGANITNATGIVKDSDTFHNALTIQGLTAAGDQVRLASADLTYSSSNSKFTPEVSARNFVYTGTLPTDKTSDSTVISAYFAGTNGVLSATATVEAVKETPVADSVYISYDREARRTGVMTVVNNVVQMTATDFTARFGGNSVLWYNYSTGLASTATAPVVFGAESKFGEHYLNEVRVQTVSGAGVLTVAPNTGVVTITTPVTSGDEFVFTGITSNGKVADFRVKITGSSTAASDVVTAVQTMAATDNAASLTINALVSAGITGTVAGNLDSYKAAITAVTAADVDTIAEIQSIITAVNNSATAISAMSFSFDGANAAKIMGITTDYAYSLDGGTTWLVATSANQTLTAPQLASITAVNDIKVRLVANTAINRTFDVLAGPAAPAVTLNTTTPAAATFVGAATTMEYTIDDGLTWTAIAGGETVDTTGAAVIKVRVAATGLTLAGAATAAL